MVDNSKDVEGGGVGRVIVSVPSKELLMIHYSLQGQSKSKHKQIYRLPIQSHTKAFSFTIVVENGCQF